MKRLTFFGLLLLAICFYGKGQVNYVVNPSFEILITCPSGTGQIFNAIGWDIPLGGGGDSPDLYNVCCTNPSECGVPSQVFYHTFQYPYYGNSYSGIQTTSSGIINYREYIQTNLVRKLKAGNTYCVTFYASLSDQSNAFIKPLGAYLDDGSVSTPGLHGLAAVTPQVYNTTTLLIDTVNWMKIEDSFIANGSEEYITLGNFFPDSLSDIGIIGSPTFWGAYYYIDDVSLIETDLPARAGKDTLIHNPGDSVFIGRQPEVGLDEDCIWLVGGVPIDTVAGLWVKPDSTTTYVLQQTICGYVKYDTVTITVSGVGVDEYGGGNAWVHLYPNPNDGNMKLDYKMPIAENGLFEMYDLIGRKVYSQELNREGNSLIISGASLSSGIYYYQVTAGRRSVGKDKIVIIK